MFGKLPFLKEILSRRAAKKEVMIELRTNPFGGYGLYHLMNDAGLLSVNAKTELEPLITKVERRMDLSEEDLVISLPLKFDPLTDEEHDTLTFVIGKVLRKFSNDFSRIEDRLRIAEIAGLVDMLERHKELTAALNFEITLEALLSPILRECANRISFTKQFTHKESGIYMELNNLETSQRFFPNAYLEERQMFDGEVVRVLQILKHGYVEVMRLNYACAYKRKWYLYKSQHRLQQLDNVAVVYRKEGKIFRLPVVYREPVAHLIDLYLYNMTDKSYDVTRYSPIRNYKQSAE